MNWKTIYKLFVLLFLAVGLAVLPEKSSAQEIFCNVVVRPEGSQNLDQQTMESIKRAVSDFMNQRRRTNDNVATEEKILCNMIISITKSPRIGYYEATAQIQSTRPIYGASIESVMFNYLDNNFTFEFTEGQPMEFNDNSPQYTDNLTSLLSFYAYIIMGIDYDSYGKLGGLPWFRRAQLISQNASNVDGYKGWRPFEGTNNRNWLIENYMNQQLLPFREGLYNYHRLGLDKFSSNPAGARVQVQDMLTRIKNVLTLKPISIAINTFMDAKSQEIINIFAMAEPSEKQAAYNTLVSIDPTKTERYQKLLQ
jgi:hypothetical protein